LTPFTNKNIFTPDWTGKELYGSVRAHSSFTAAARRDWTAKLEAFTARSGVRNPL